jgi:integrase
MSATFCLIDKRRALQDGTFPIKISAGCGTGIYLSTGISVKLWEWDPDSGKIVDRKDAKRLNAFLEVRLLRTRARMLQLREDGRLATCTTSHIRKLLEAPDMGEVPMEERRTDFYEIAERCIGTKDRPNTRQIYRYTVDKVRAYAGDRLFIEDMTLTWLHGFEKSLGGKVNARAVHLRNLRAVCNFALDEELTTFYPFRKFKIRTEETRKKALTLEQIRAFAEADVTYRNDAMHRDVFMLMFYLRGINISDLAALTWDDVEDGRIHYRRNKTGHLYSIRIEPEAQEILDRWRGEEHLLSVFDRYRNPTDYNRRLSDAMKRIQGPDGNPVEPDCSGNWARHTWATMAAELDIPEATISWALGHVPGHRTTQIYIRRSDAKCDDANRMVIDCLKGDRPASHDAGREVEL